MAIPTIPTVHLNGSSGPTLADGYRSAVDSLRTAITFLSATYPNARDYYVQGDDAFGRALAEHQSRMDRLVGVREELVAVLDALDDARLERDCRK